LGSLAEKNVLAQLLDFVTPQKEKAIPRRLFHGLALRVFAFSKIVFSSVLAAIIVFQIYLEY
jgi:hypothetical protein